MTIELSRRWRLNGNLILRADLLYLLLPCILFLLGWVQAYIAIPLSIALVACAVILCHRELPLVASTEITTGVGNNNNSFSTKDLIKLSISLILLLLLTEFIGFHGHVQQSNDFIVRTPIYSTLIREDWPIYSRTGDYFVYYHAFWLPPALLCKWLHLQQYADTVLFCWTYLGLALTALTFFLRLRGKILTFTIILILAGSASAPVDACFRWFTPQEYRSIVFQYGCDSNIGQPGYWVQVVNTFNHAVTAGLLYALAMHRGSSTGFLLFTAGIGFCCTPFVGIILLIVIAVEILRRKEFRKTVYSPAAWLSVAILLLNGLYMSLNSSAGGKSAIATCFLADSPHWQSIPYGNFGELSVRIIRCITLIVPFGVLLYAVLQKRLRKGAIFRQFMLVLTVSPSIWIGRGNNEFLFKTSFIVFILYSLLMTLAYHHATNRHRALIITVITACGMGFFCDINFRSLWEWSTEPEMIRAHKISDMGESIDHPESGLYHNFFGKNKLPSVFYAKPGESSCVFPEWGK